MVKDESGLIYSLFPTESKGVVFAVSCSVREYLHSWKIYSCGLTFTPKAKDVVVALIVDC